MLKARSPDLTRIRRHEFRQVAINRTAFSRAISRDGFSQCLAEAQNLRGDLRFPRCVRARPTRKSLPIVFESALRRHVERAIGPASMQANHAARPDDMADAEFVKDVRIEDRDIRENEVRRDELGEHVLEDVAGAFPRHRREMAADPQLRARAEEHFDKRRRNRPEGSRLCSLALRSSRSRGFFGTSFFPKGMTTKTRRLKLKLSAVMAPLQLHPISEQEYFVSDASLPHVQET